MVVEEGEGEGGGQVTNQWVFLGGVEREWRGMACGPCLSCIGVIWCCAVVFLGFGWCHGGCSSRGVEKRR